MSNTLQTKVPHSDRFRLKPDSPILHFQPSFLALLAETNCHSLALAVLAGIGQRFLRNTVQGILEDRRESSELHVTVEVDFRPTPQSLFVNEV